MRVVMFYHSLISDWNHGNAHFLRGVASELIERGHEVAIYEPRDGWSLRNLIAEHGEEPIRGFQAAYPCLRSTMYDAGTLDLDRALDGADLVIVHEWNDPDLVRRIGRHRATRDSYRLLFHDTHHRAVTEPRDFAATTRSIPTTAYWLSAKCCVISTLLAGGRAASGSGTRLPVPACSGRSPPRRPKVTWCGSATLATTSAPRRFRNS